MRWRDEFNKAVKFGLVGGAGLLINLALTYALTDYLGVWYLLSFAIAAFFNWTFIFYANGRFTFSVEDGRSTGARYVQFMLSYLGLFCFNLFLVYALTSLLGMYYIFSIVLGTVVTTMLTFAASRLFIFETWKR